MTDSRSTEKQRQHARFLETARALECDEEEAAFDEKLKAVVRPKLGEEIPKPKPPRTAR